MDTPLNGNHHPDAPENGQDEMEPIPALEYTHPIYAEFEKEILKPALVYVQIWHRQKSNERLRASIAHLVQRPYTHMMSSLDCVLRNWEVTYGRILCMGGADLFHANRETFLRGPRDAPLWPRFDDDGRPIDFHYLENYHYWLRESFEEERLLPHEDHPVRWPNLVVRLEEVYDCVKQIMGSWIGVDDKENTHPDPSIENGPSNPPGPEHLFGFFSRPYVYMQEYWILVDSKESDFQIHPRRPPPPPPNANPSEPYTNGRPKRKELPEV
ncbi:hypothetical protein AAE478_000041 [Parahypoxylon ruwenzoriense]